MSGRRRKPLATEHQEQVALFQWAALNERRMPELRWLFAIPNGGKRHPVTAMRLKAEGVKPGVPDLCLPVPRGNYHGLWIEMKRARGGRIAPCQDEWHDYLWSVGYCVGVCNGWTVAQDLIRAYLRTAIHQQLQWKSR